MEALSDNLDNTIKTAAPQSRYLINIKQAAWRTRAIIGPGYGVLTPAIKLSLANRSRDGIQVDFR